MEVGFTIPVWLLYGLAGLGIFILGFVIAILLIRWASSSVGPTF